MVYQDDFIVHLRPFEGGLGKSIHVMELEVLHTMYFMGKKQIRDSIFVL